MAPVLPFHRDENEQTDLVVADSLLLEPSVADSLVERNYVPAPLTNLGEPSLIAGVAGEVIIGDLDGDARLAKRRRDGIGAEIAVEEEDGERLGAHAASGSSKRIASSTSAAEQA